VWVHRTARTGGRPPVAGGGRWRPPLPVDVALALILCPPAVCAETPDPDLPAEGIFVDEAGASGLEFQYFNGMAGDYLFPEIIGGGGALFDFDNDGDLDVYLVQGRLLGEGSTVSDALIAPQGPLHGRLFRNDLEILPDGGRRLRFAEVTAGMGVEADGYGVTVATGDYDNDGWIDLYLANVGSNQLLRNQGDGSFSDQTGASGTDDPRWSVPAAFVDYDRDGWLDLFVGTYVDYSVERDKECRTMAGAADYCGPLSYNPAPDRLWRNRGDGTFENVSERAGILAAWGTALGVVATDLNGDNWPEIYVANDGVPNQMWVNQRDGTFRDEALLSGAAVNMMGRPEAGMGVTAGDFDSDGDEDLFLTHLDRETNTLYRNDGEGFFEDATVRVGLGQPSWKATGFGTAWLDFDNDGWLDLVTANGAVHVPEEGAGDRLFPLDQPNQLFRNLGDGRFEEVTDRAGAVFGLSEVSRGLATGDVDNDGDVDILLVNNSAPTRLLVNRLGQRRSWVGLRLTEGTPPRDALGARVGLVLSGSRTLWRRVSTGGSYASASDPRLRVGLADFAGALAVRVHWPDGSRSLHSLAAEHQHVLYHRREGSQP
jgi:hypothetical protein